MSGIYYTCPACGQDRVRIRSARAELYGAEIVGLVGTGACIACGDTREYSLTWEQFRDVPVKEPPAQTRPASPRQRV